MAKPLEVDRISKIFNGFRAVNEVEISVDKGEIFGLLGGNGAGKTTTMRMVLGIIHPDEGQVRYNGKAYSDELTQLMGYLPEERGLYPKLKVSEQITYLAKLRGLDGKEADKRLKHWLERFGVPEYYDKKIEELSKGNQQKMQFIAAVIHEPQILILDEAFSGLDPVNVELLKDTVKDLRDKGSTILFSTHRMEHVEELCQEICILHKSNTVLKGNLKQIKNSFPKEKVRLRTEQPVQRLEQVNGVLNIQNLENGETEVRIDRVDAAQQLLQVAMEQTMVHKFEIMEPTLNEIFIRSVGERNE